MYDIIDLHCDLLAYLAMTPERDPFNLDVPCSAPRLQQGNVTLQTLAITAITNCCSLVFGLRQYEIFLQLPKLYPDHFTQDNIVCAFENASAFCIEDEPLDIVLKRLENMLTQITPLYISLTWNGKNRFGGGCGSQVPLTEEGEELLSFLSGRGIAIDFSHASDALSRSLFDTIDKKGLDIPILASHCNFRSVHDDVRNLPDDVAKEIIDRKGVIGLVFYKSFLKEPKQLFDHITYGYKLGGENSLAFGADFFYTPDLSDFARKDGGFFEEMGDASCYPWVLNMLEEHGLSKSQLSAIASENARALIEEMAVLGN